MNVGLDILVMKVARCQMQQRLYGSRIPNGQSKGLKMKDMPWMKFYPADWRAEKGLKLISRAARSLWIDLLCLMFESGTGRLEINGHPATENELSKIFGDNPRTIKKLISEIELAGVSSRDQDRFIISRRIIKDRIKAEQDISNGRKGGNPSLKNNNLEENWVNPPDKAQILEARSYIPEEERKEKPKKVFPKENRGTRLPIDFEPDATCHAVAEQMLFTTRQSQIEFEKFKDYWNSKPGASGIKLDWQATFRNWLRNSKPQGEKQNGNQKSNYKKGSIHAGFELINAAFDREEASIREEEIRLGVG